MEAEVTFDHPTDEHGRYICCREHPMPKEHARVGRWVHSETHEVGEQEDGWPGGDIVRMECRVCGHRWRTELPQ